MALRATFVSSCRNCGGTINKGDAIVRDGALLKYVHENCLVNAVQEHDKSSKAQAIKDWATKQEQALRQREARGNNNNEASEASEARETREETPTMSDTSDAVRKVLGPMADLLAPLIEEKISAKVDEERVNALIQESQVAQDQIYSQLHDAMRDQIAQMVAKQPISVQIKSGAKLLRKIDRVHVMFPKLAYLYKIRKHAYLWGAPGGGKSTVARQLADAVGVPFGYISCDPYTPSSHIMGYKDANGVYHETIYYQIYTKGGIYCIDEADNMSPALGTTLNSSLENGWGAFPCGMVKQHPDFVCVATGNTAGRGATKRHADRRVFDAAFAERFKFLEWNYDEALELAIVKDINPNAAYAITAWVKQVRELAAKRYPALVVSPRASFGIAQFALDSGWSREEILDTTLFKGLEITQKQAILAECPPTWPVTPADEIHDDVVEEAEIIAEEKAEAGNEAEAAA